MFTVYVNVRIRNGSLKVVNSLSFEDKDKAIESLIYLTGRFPENKITMSYDPKG